jgi:hypothetical protein
MDTHVKVLGWLFILFGAVYVLLAFAFATGFSLLATFVAAQPDDGSLIGASILGLAGSALFIFWLCVGIPGIITGWGLLTTKSWARIVGIILSAVRLISFPIGTALGIYGLWVLFHKDTEAMFNGAKGQ